jgi:proteasome lid subunit RPN8/RPN11
MLQALVRRAGRLLDDLQRSLFRFRRPAAPAAARHPEAGPARPGQAAAPVAYAPLQRVLLTDGVGHTLFEEFAGHRREHGEDETGWVLLGLRNASEAVVLATLPAGALADVGVAHVRFNSEAQAVASRIVRQADRRLTIVGVVHTHPGSLRHPSDGDYRGDREWVAHLRGREGVFGIGTADGPGTPGAMFGHQPRPSVQCWGDLRFCWYALAEGQAEYRPLPVEVTYGPDLARPLHRLWSALEVHAGRLDRLYRQLTGVRFEVIADDFGPGLVLVVPLPEEGGAVRVLVRAKEVRYYVARDGDLLEVDPGEESVDRAVFLLLAELAARS